MSLLDQVYLPDLEKRNIRDSDSYKLLKDNKLDASVLEGYEKEKTHEPFEIPTFNDQADKDKFVEDNANAAASSAIEYIETFGNFLTDETDDLVTSLSLAATNGADVAVNLMPLFYNMMKNTNLGMTMPPEFWSPKTEEQVMSVAQHWSDNLGEYRKELFEKQKDNGWVKDILSFVVQDSVYSIPAYNYLRKLGIPKYPSFFLAGAAGAIGVENQDRDGDKTYFDPFAKDIIELKNLIGILPNTPEDKIADEVAQALEYGTFSMAIPAVIDSLKFMKRYIPHFAAGTGMSVGLFADNEAEGSPIKSILKAVDSAPMFKSAVVDAAEKLPPTGTGEQIYNTIKNTPGVKESELKWMDLDRLIGGDAKTKFDKQRVLDIINNNRIDVSEVKLMAGDRAIKTDDALESLTNDFELKWLKSQYADEATYAAKEYEHQMLLDNNLNYDVYKIGIDDARYLPDDQQVDWQSFNRNPVVLALDDTFDFQGGMISQVSDGTIFNYKNMLNHPKYKDWINVNGDIRGYVVELNKNVSKIKEINEIVGANLKPIGGTENRVVVNGKQLTKLEEAELADSGILTSYKIPQIEFEKYLVEGQKRQFRLQNTDQMPIFMEQTSPGGANYTELVFKIKNKEGTTPAILEGEFGTLANNKVKSEVKTSINYSSPHFNKMNEFAHVRFKTRTLPNGKKVLAVEEMQSDLLQASKTDLFSSAKAQIAAGDKVLKDFPFKNTWYEFTIKRLTRYAADNGFDAIAIPKGSLAANRYGQSTFKAKKVKITPDLDAKTGEPNSDDFTLEWIDGNGKTVKKVKLNADTDYFIDAVKNYEKEIAGNFAEFQTTLLEATDTYTAKEFDFPSEAVLGSGSGKFRLYDKTIPSYMKKYAKKWNAKVYDDLIETDRVISERVTLPGTNKIPVTILELSDGMKKDVVSSSQPLFEIFGTVSLSTWAAKEVSDNMQNNIISQTTENMY
ncbi:hypothetical protein [uncultured Mediterranean phage uvMED]|nr:hypothetical protein [uncultured Mediterranean phage uvMED]